MLLSLLVFLGASSRASLAALWQRPEVPPHHGHHEESIFEEFVDEVKLCPWLLFASC